MPVAENDRNFIMDNMVCEVIADGSASGFSEVKLSELQQKRPSLKGRSIEDAK
jgi:hypothetical protein